MSTDTAKAVIYARRSTAKQTHSLSRQIDVCRECCAGLKLTIEATVARTGSGSPDWQPELDRVVALCIDTRSHLVVESRERLARNAGLVANVESRLARNGLRLISAYEVDDSPQIAALRKAVATAVAEAEAIRLIRGLQDSGMSAGDILRGLQSRAVVATTADL